MRLERATRSGGFFFPIRSVLFEASRRYSALARRASLCPAPIGEITILGTRSLITAHLSVGPAFEIADCELFQEWIGLHKFFSRRAAGCVGAGQE
jgi:hypothetical protein